jgi:hypothetical protein
MKIEQMVKMIPLEEADSFAVGRYLRIGESRLVGDKHMQEHHIMLGQGGAVRVAVFSSKGAASVSDGKPPGLKFGDTVIMPGFKPAVGSGYLNCSAISVELLTKS